MIPITYLFVPGDRPERFQKAVASGADMVVIDLEDAVLPERKGDARGRVRDALADGSIRACVRINGTDTTWFDDDARLLSLAGVAAVMLPKAEDPARVAQLGNGLARTGVPLVPIIETARGLAASEAIAACTGVQRLAFGSVDFQVDLGIEGDGEELWFARSRLVLASRLAGIAAPIDGVTLAVSDAGQATRDAVRARRMGFSAKLCIHPAQVAPVREGFMPTAHEIAWARGVIDIAGGQPLGALTYEGKLIDKPVVDRAKAILARA
jgi:citrate lyase subunit beta/citryl-CoA lyase